MGEIARKFVVAAALAAFTQLLVSPAAMAAGLGRLNVFSALGEPLKAEIEIVSLQASERDSLAARLASNEAFRQANIDLNGALLGVKFAVESRGSQYVVSLTSAQPMNEPFIDMLVELTWNSGRLTREYTFLLDPPEYRGPATSSVPPVEPPTVQSAPLAPQVPATPVAKPAAQPAAPAPAPQPAAEPARPAPKPAAAAPAAQRAAGGTYEVKRGDTLAKIAQRNAAEGVSLQQMLVALYRNNPDAFDGANMNRLRAGRILNLPDRETAAGVSVNDARKEISSQSAAYGKYRSSLGEAVASAPARAESGRQAAGKVGAPAEEKAATPKEPAKDQVRLSRPGEAGAKGAVGKAAAADDSAAKDKAIKDANERIALLEKNIAAMKSQSGAQLQQQAQAAKAGAKADAKAPAAKAEAPKAEPAKAEAAKPEAAKPEASKAPEAAKPEAPKAEEAAKSETPAAPKADAAPKAAPKPVAPPPAPPEASFADQLLEDPLTLAGGGAVVVLLAGYAFYAVRRKRKQAAEAAGSSISTMTEPSFAGSMLASSGVEEVAQAEETPLDAGLGGADAVAPESEEIDPVAEADVYMAYGRDGQAEEILKDALGRNPGHLAARLKLLEIYANRKDAAAFEAEARQVHEATGGQGADWDKAAALGAAVDPGNALYGGAPEASAGVTDTQVMPAGADVTAPAPDLVLDSGVEESAPALDFDLGTPDATAAAEPVAEAPAVEIAAPEAAPAALDFDLDLGSPEAAPLAAPEPVAEVPAADDGISIDFELPDMGQAAAPAEVAAAPSDEAPSIDFDLGSADTPAAPAAEEAAPMLDLSSISLDLGSADDAQAAAPNAQWQEVATKLDLAKAYQDMGDKDGARELLNEVLKEGDAAQQEQARTMLEAVG